MIKNEMREPSEVRKVGILGLGSIGRRHARILKSLHPDVAIAAYRTNKGALREPVDGILNLDREAFLATRFDLLVVANPSALHLETLELVLPLNRGATILVEKPFCLPQQLGAAKSLIRAYPETQILPGNCLRFHPAIDVLHEEIARGEWSEALECHAHFGSYMPGWHPYEDYRNSYAARRDLGGGVLLTSIHEIDLAHHLFGQGRMLGASVGNIVLHEIDVEDCAHLVMSLERCKICNISLNFFERPASRYLKVIYPNGVFSWTFGEAHVTTSKWRNGHADERHIPVDGSVDSMYINMWKKIFSCDLSSFEFSSVENSLNTIAVLNSRMEPVTWNLA